MLGPEGARFANDLRAWVEVEDGRIAGYGQDGGGRVSNTLFRLRGMRVQIEAVTYPELRPEPVVALEQGRRTATIRAVTDCRVVSYLAADLSSDDLRELAAGHHWEDEQP
ncbi:MAG TPA: hypothetical protein VGR98_21645 [Streptosporangiaceae bacterium]|nr:hypothetical protein [Streptosporangiaceae bacterium]